MESGFGSRVGVRLETGNVETVDRSNLFVVIKSEGE